MVSLLLLFSSSCSHRISLPHAVSHIADYHQEYH